MSYIPILVLGFFWFINTLVIVRRVLSAGGTEDGPSHGGSLLAVLMALAWLWAIISVTPH